MLIDMNGKRWQVKPESGAYKLVVGGAEYYANVDPRVLPGDLKIGAQILVALGLGKIGARAAFVVQPVPGEEAPESIRAPIEANAAACWRWRATTNRAPAAASSI